MMVEEPPGRSSRITPRRVAATIAFAATLWVAFSFAADGGAANANRAGTCAARDVPTRYPDERFGNVSVRVANWPATGKRGRMEIHLTRDATGSRTITAWPVDKWVGGSAPTLGAANGDVDIIVITSDDGGTTRLGARVGTAS